MPISLYQKYRPQKFDDILGQEHVVSILKAEIQTGDISHAYIFIGPRGTGKTTTARIFANVVNCEHPNASGNPCGECKVCKSVKRGKFLDLIEKDAASNRGVENIRELKEKVNMAPVMGKYKVYIIDEVHMLTKEAFNALLKTLEEPPEHVIFILATTEPHKVPATIMSRCERFIFYLADEQKLSVLIDQIAQKENVKVSNEAKNILIRQANGSYRDLLSILDPIFSTAKQNNNGDVTEELALSMIGLFDSSLVESFLQALFSLEPSKVQESLNLVLRKAGNIQAFIQVLIDALRGAIEQYHKTRSFPAYFGTIKYVDVVSFLGYLIEEYTQIRFLYTDSLALELAVYKFLADHDLKGSTTINEVYASSVGDVTMGGSTMFHDVDTGMQTNHDIQKVTMIKGSGAVLESMNDSNVTQAQTGNAPNETKDKTERHIKKSIAHKISKKIGSISKHKHQKMSSNTAMQEHSNLDISEINRRWQLFLKRVRNKRGPLYAILILSVPDALKRNSNGVYELRLYVPYDYHKKKIEDANTRKLLQDIFKNVYGEIINAVAIVSKKKAKQIPPSIHTSTFKSNLKLNKESSSSVQNSTNNATTTQSQVDTSNSPEVYDTVEDPIGDIFADDLEL